MDTIFFNHVYVESRATAVGPLEASGPLQGLFDETFQDLYCFEKNFEQAERRLLASAVDHALRKSGLQVSDIDVIVAGDLMNQLMSSHYFGRDLSIPFVGMYAACATSSLIIGQAAIYVEQQLARRALAFTSSHVACAERQFRFPNEYGIQKKDTTTSTVTGAGAVVLGRKKTKIALKSFTIGKIVDWKYTNANDMGNAMVPAAFDTLQRHLKNCNHTLNDYDCIVTGDLSELGSAFLKDLLTQEGYEHIENVSDCGLRIYDVKSQDVFCGGSGPACSMIVSLTELLNKIEEGVFHRVLVLATGALLSPVAIQQKESIPCIAHGIVYERSDVSC